MAICYQINYWSNFLVTNLLTLLLEFLEGNDSLKQLNDMCFADGYRSELVCLLC